MCSEVFTISGAICYNNTEVCLSVQRITRKTSQVLLSDWNELCTSMKHQKMLNPCFFTLIKYALYEYKPSPARIKIDVYGIPNVDDPTRGIHRNPCLVDKNALN